MKIITVFVSMLLLAIGFSSSAFASHCDVRSGDTIWHIAKRYHINFKDLKDLNQKLFKDLDLIHPYDEVDLPDGDHGQTTNNHSSTDTIEESNNNVTDRGEVSQMTEILNLVNDERKKQGLNPLVLNHTLNGVAMEKAFDMKEKNYFSHESPTYGSPFEMLQHFGVKYSYAGENIAAGQKTSEQVMNDWMNSSGHRANILNKNYTELGVGYVDGGSKGTYWVQIFIKPQ
jgi:uncharacterized YkwD family protein